MTLPYRILAALLALALAAGGGFWFGQSYADGQHAKQDNKQLRDQIKGAAQDMSALKSVIGESLTQYEKNKQLVQVPALLYLENKQHVEPKFDTLAKAIEVALAKRPDLDACRFGAEFLRDANKARSGSLDGGQVGATDSGVRSGVAASMQSDGATDGRQGQDARPSSGAGRQAIQRLQEPTSAISAMPAQAGRDTSAAPDGSSRVSTVAR